MPNPSVEMLKALKETAKIVRVLSDSLLELRENFEFHLKQDLVLLDIIEELKIKVIEMDDNYEVTNKNNN